MSARRSAAATQAARRGIHGRASLMAADGNHLVPRPNSDGEGAGAAAQNRVGAVVERLKGWNQDAPTDPDEGGGEQLGWQLTGQLSARIVPRQRRSRTSKVLANFFTMVSTESSSFHLLLLRRCHETVPEPFSYLARRFLHDRDRRRHHRCHRRGTRPVNGHRHKGWTSDLFSSEPKSELGGSPVDTCLHPY